MSASLEPCPICGHAPLPTIREMERHVNRCLEGAMQPEFADATDAPVAPNASPHQPDEATSGASTPPQPAIDTTQSFEDKIDALKGICPQLSQSDCERLLESCDGNLELAAQTLLTYMYEQVPPAQPSGGGGGSGGKQPVVAKTQQRSKKAGRPGPTMVEVVVYNLAPDSVAGKIGLGMYHTGVLVYGREYAFGGSWDKTAKHTGVFFTDKGGAADNIKKVIEIGETPHSEDEIKALIEELSAEWTVDKYHVLSRNCNHFSSTLLQRLNPEWKLPTWVNRAANVGNKVVPNFILKKFMDRARPPTADGEEEEEAPTPESPPMPPRSPAAAPSTPNATETTPKAVREAGSTSRAPGDASAQPKAFVFEQELDAVLQVLPDVNKEAARAALIKYGGHVERTVNHLLSA